MTKQLFDEEAVSALKNGCYQVYKAVTSTLSARGRNVVYHKWGAPKITNDGVTVARQIELEDPFENAGAQLIKQAAETTNSEAGDGTTTSILLAYSFIEKGISLINLGINPMILKKSIEKQVEKIIKRLGEIAIPVSTTQELKNIATISVENPEHGVIIADAIEIAGKDGIIQVEESEMPGVVKEVVNGYRFDRGYENEYLVTDAEKMEAVLEDPYILIAEKKWNLLEDLFPLFNSLKEEGKDKILIIADEISGQLMQGIVINRLKLKFHAVVVKTPFNKSSLEDIAALTGATALTEQKGIVNPKKEHLGRARKVIVTKDHTTIIDGYGNPEQRITELRSQVEGTEEGYEREKLKERLSKLAGKTVILHVGAPTPAEAKYLKDKLDDAVSATRAASEEGIVAGGGMALFRIANELYPNTDPIYEEDSHSMMIEKYMRSVLLSPVDKIMRNSGISTIEEHMKSLSGVETSGFDALEGKIVENIIEKGIIDPVKVTRCAMKNASSLAQMLLTTETLIVDSPEKQ